LNPSVSVNDPSAVTAPIGVAEAANRYKTDKATLNARVLNNENVLLIVNRNSSGRSMALNMLPTEQNGQPQSADAQTAPAPSTTQAPASANQAQPADAQTNAENATTPQINQNQQSNDAQGTTRLPATATFLPLLGLLGLASGGFGLLVRKFRK
jgi:glucan-binding YG repeat protein